MNNKPKIKQDKTPPHPHEVLGTRYGQYQEIEGLTAMNEVLSKLIENRYKDHKWKIYFWGLIFLEIIVISLYFLKKIGG